MSVSIKEIVAKIALLNNQYRDRATPIRAKLEAMWEIGDVLVQLRVTKPHAIGWAVQKETRGLIKRPTVFRSYKVRIIWDAKDSLMNDLGALKSLSNLTEILPLIDPAQEVRSKLSAQQLEAVYKHACYDAPKKFKEFINELKKEYAHDRLGSPLNRERHLKELEDARAKLRLLIEYLNKLISGSDLNIRDKFREDTAEIEVRSFSNMCISLTTKDNLRLYKNIGPGQSSSKNDIIRFLYDYFHSILNKKSDDERARLRRLVSADVLAQISDMVSSLLTEDGVKDFKARQRMSIKL